MTTNNVDPDGPLDFSPIWPPDPKLAELLTTKLGGWATSPRWLPEGVWKPLKEVRDEHLRVRAVVAADLEKLRAIRARHAAEDAGYEAALSQAVRAGIDPPKDQRTPPAKRASEREKIERSIAAGIKVLAEVVGRAKAPLRKHEEKWLADANRGSIEAAEAVREHERLLFEAKRKAWQGVLLAQWLKRAVEDGPFGVQPAPTGDDPMPPTFDPAGHTDAFVRHWYEQDRVAPVLPADDDPLALEEDEVAEIEPLDLDDRFVKR